MSWRFADSAFMRRLLNVQALLFRSPLLKSTLGLAVLHHFCTKISVKTQFYNTLFVQPSFVQLQSLQLLRRHLCRTNQSCRQKALPLRCWPGKIETPLQAAPDNLDGVDFLPERRGYTLGVITEPIASLGGLDTHYPSWWWCRIEWL